MQLTKGQNFHPRVNIEKHPKPCWAYSKIWKQFFNIGGRCNPLHTHTQRHVHFMGTKTHFQYLFLLSCLTMTRILFYKKMMLKWINLNRETTAHYSKNIKDWQKKLNADNEWTILSGDGVINRKNINTQKEYGPCLSRTWIWTSKLSMPISNYKIY